MGIELAVICQLVAALANYIHYGQFWRKFQNVCVYIYGLIRIAVNK